MTCDNFGRRVEVRAVGHGVGHALVVDLGDVHRGIPCRQSCRSPDVFGDLVGHDVQGVAEEAARLAVNAELAFRKVGLEPGAQLLHEHRSRGLERFLRRPDLADDLHTRVLSR